MIGLRLLFVALLLAIVVPFAAADLIQLNHNNLGIVGSIGTVNLQQQNGGVMVTISANSGYSIKLPGGDILFNSNANLNAGSFSQLLIDGKYTANFGLSTGQTRAGLTFSYDMTNFMKGTLPKGYISAGTVSFFISGVTVKQLEMAGKNGAMWGIHFCVGGGTSCGTGNTGFAWGRSGGTVPEPGTLSLLGTGIVGLAGLFRRRFRA